VFRFLLHPWPFALPQPRVPSADFPASPSKRHSFTKTPADSSRSARPTIVSSTHKARQIARRNVGARAQICAAWRRHVLWIRSHRARAPRSSDGAFSVERIEALKADEEGGATAVRAEDISCVKLACLFESLTHQDFTPSPFVHEHARGRAVRGDVASPGQAPQRRTHKSRHPAKHG
jgi:hypothetical protein